MENAERLEPKGAAQGRLPMVLTFGKKTIRLQEVEADSASCRGLGSPGLPREAIHDKLKRVRTPRCHISYEIETFGTDLQRELPFVIGVLADFSGIPGMGTLPCKTASSFRSTATISMTLCYE